MSVVTFYSYKGGVGRSMALANVATLLARMGRKVLVVDWDLEAPGLEEYFTGFQISSQGRGLLPMLNEVRAGENPDYRNHLWRLQSATEDTSLAILQSGREEQDYYPMLERFSQSDFFDKGGGDFLERLREQWLREFDFVLIDSRTGLSDAGGICTILLPDIVVALFTATFQSLHGVRDVLRLAKEARNRLAYDRTALSIIPVPARFDWQNDARRGGVWIENFANAVGEFLDDWLPRDQPPVAALKQLAIAHFADLLHGAVLSVHSEEHASCPANQAYERIADLIAGDLRELETLGIENQADAKPVASRGGGTDYQYDVYISCPRGGHISEWVARELLPPLQLYLEAMLGYPPRLFFDRAQLSAGGSWPEKVEAAARRSRVLAAVLTASYFRSSWCVAEWKTFERREAVEQRGATADPGDLIIPIRISGDADFPKYAQSRQLSDFADVAVMGPGFRQSRRFFEFEKKVKRLAEVISNAIVRAPHYKEDWPLVLPEDAGKFVSKGRRPPPRP